MWTCRNCRLAVSLSTLPSRDRLPPRTGKSRVLLCFSLLPFYGWENEGRQESNAAEIVEISVLSKITPVWGKYLKRFKIYSIFNCRSSEIQDGGQNGGNFRRHLTDRFLLSRGIFAPKGMFVAFAISSLYISLQTSRHTYRHPSIA
jgi:hypothetical protein